MQVHKIDNCCNNVTFGKIILDCTYPVKTEIPANKLLHSKAKLKELKSAKPDEFQFLGDTLSEVIEYDFRDSEPQFWNRFQELVESQEENPYDIHLDVFPEDKGEIPLESYRWYQKAIVGGKEFKQRVYAFQGTAIKFLEDACKYANKLKNGIIEPEPESEISNNLEQELELIQDAPRRVSLLERLFAIFY